MWCVLGVQRVFFLSFFKAGREDDLDKEECKLMKTLPSQVFNRENIS